MAKVSPAVSEASNENVNEATTSDPKSKKSAEPMEVDDNDESGEEEESEYEIEAILDAKRGLFPGGRMGFFVRWKGYGEEENSWVDEKDAGNAEGLIVEYWKNQKQKKPRKSTDTKAPKRPRKSAAPEDGSEIGSAKKRGRKSQAKADSDLENGKDDEDGSRVTKKQRKNATKAHPKEPVPPPAIEEVEIGDMSKYMDAPSWEDLIASVDTIEREDNGSLTVYFSLKSGERVREDSQVCAQRFPQNLIRFYEGNLRWRTAGSDADS